MSRSRSYTISEAAALTGRHRNTIRQYIRTGQLAATVQPGKFGEEYRIAHEALVAAGLLPEEGPLASEGNGALDAEFTAEEVAEGDSAAPPVTLQALAELYQRHEQAMFRLGYLQSELERMKALAETAESLRKDNEAHAEEVRALKSALEQKERQAREAEALRRELERTRERLREMESLQADLELLKSQVARQEQELESLQSARRPWWRFWS